MNNSELKTFFIKLVSISIAVIVILSYLHISLCINNNLIILVSLFFVNSNNLVLSAVFLYCPSEYLVSNSNSISNSFAIIVEHYQ